MEIKSLNKNSEFSYIRKFGKKNKFNFITISTTKNENKDFKLGFQISTKTGNAVFRNRIKRRMRSILRDAIKTINMNLNYSYLFIAKKNIYDANYKMIKDSIFKDLNKVR